MFQFFPVQSSTSLRTLKSGFSVEKWILEDYAFVVAAIDVFVIHHATETGKEILPLLGITKGSCNFLGC